MPELPEVETIRRDLERLLRNKRITKAEVKLPRLVKGGIKAFKKALTGNGFKKIDRRGKLLVFYLKKGSSVLLVHLKMTGQLVYRKGDKFIPGGHSLPKVETCLPNKYSHIYFTFLDGSHLFFNDLRTFGYMEIKPESELGGVYKRFGPEPLKKEFTLKYLNDTLKNRTAPVKASLLDQRLIAGIGNIYADEALFMAKIRPDRQGKTLKADEIKKLYFSINKVLNKAIKFRGTTFNNYVDASGNTGNFVKHLKVYGRGAKPCLNCGQYLSKIKLSGRGTHFCAKCQV